MAALLLMPTGRWAQKHPPASPPAEVKKEKPPEVPDLAELMLQANKLPSRLVVLETKIAPGLDVKAPEKSLQDIEASLEKYPPIIEQLRASPSINFDKIAAYKDTIRLNEDDLEDVIQPLTKAIKKLGAARKEWLEERKQWQEWRSALLTDETLDEVKSIIAGAQKTIDSALFLIN